MTLRTEAIFRRSVEWGGRKIRYSLAFAPRRRLAITVHPDLRVEVVAPEGQSVEAVEQRVEARRAWIARQLRDFERHHPHPPPRRWVPGETHLYLGRQYRLRIHEGLAEVWRAGGRLHVRLPDASDTPGIETALGDWYAARARAVFNERLDRVRAEHPRLGQLSPRLRVLRMKRRWGSCSAQGTISLNVQLVKAPISCIDYVIIHELCHMIEHRHSKRFFRLLRSFLPDWERRRERLDQPLP